MGMWGAVTGSMQRSTPILAALVVFSLVACAANSGDEVDESGAAQTGCIAEGDPCSPQQESSPGCAASTTLPGGGDRLFVGGNCDDGLLCAVRFANPKDGAYRCVAKDDVGVLQGRECVRDGKTVDFCGVGE
jgi:hypothetical protein